MKEIRRQIKEHQYHTVYLLTGDEEYLVLQAKQLLKNALVMDGDEMNYRLYENAKIDLSEFRDLANTFPFFSEKRVLVLDRTGILRDGKEEFVDILSTLPQTTCVIICEPEADKRSKVYKWIKKNGYVGEFLKKDQTDKVLMQWIAAMLKREKKKITAVDARYFLERVGDDMFQIKTEMDKLIAYTGEQEEVTRQDIDAISEGEVVNKVFELMDAIGQGDKKKALKLYDDLLILREAPLRILYLIIRHYRIMLTIADMIALKKPDSEIAQAAGVRPFVIKKYAQQIRRYHRDSILKCLEDCITVEHEIKTGKITDQLGLETVIVKLCSNAG